MNETPVPTILIVDDDRLNRAALAELLQAEGRLLLAKDGPSALQAMEREPDIALVLLDVSMPGMDGYEVLQSMRATPGLADTPVIFITGMSQECDEERGLLLGAADYVQKPIRPAIVRARVKTHLKLALQRRALEAMAMRDGLTGIANRRFFDEALERAVRQAVRAGASLGLAIVDVDHFKQYNDHYGHGAGDDALRRVADILAAYMRRPGDLAARYGGEEFVLLLPDVKDMALRLESLRGDVQNARIAHAHSPTEPVLTISGGAAVWAPGPALSGADLLALADRLLYEAKRQGRNRMVVQPLEQGAR